MIKRLALNFTETERLGCKCLEARSTQFGMSLPIGKQESSDASLTREEAEWQAEHALWVELYRDTYELLCRVRNYAKLPESLRIEVDAAIADLSPPKGEVKTNG